jgi:hypothetical protein
LPMEHHGHQNIVSNSLKLLGEFHSEKWFSQRPLSFCDAGRHLYSQLYCTQAYLNQNEWTGTQNKIYRLRPTENPNWLTWAWTRFSAVSGRQPTAWTFNLPVLSHDLCTLRFSCTSILTLFTCFVSHSLITPQSASN